jgi:hypothetical protein
MACSNVVDEWQRHGKRRIRLDLLNGMRIAALTTFADESRTMLINGLAGGSHQWEVGHLGAAVRFLAQNPMHGISPGRARRGITSVSPRPPGPQHAGLRC